MKEITIDGEIYIPKSSVSNYEPAEELDGMKYVLVRGDRSGVFAGYLESEEGRTVVLREVIRIWKWDGASSISQLAKDGVSRPENCMFPEAVSRIKILDVIEILDVTEKARLSITSVSPWKQ